MGKVPGYTIRVATGIMTPYPVSPHAVPAMLTRLSLSITDEAMDDMIDKVVRIIKLYVGDDRQHLRTTPQSDDGVTRIDLHQPTPSHQ